jgi:hypothetical protein
MQFLSLEPFIPSGSNFSASKELFTEIGFVIAWDAGDYVGFVKDGCRFVLQKYNNPEFAANLMITVKVDDVVGFRNALLEKKLQERFAIRIGAVSQQAYGREVNIIDIAGVCWHFVQ